MAVVATRDLTKVFKEGQLGAVNNVNLETREGEFLVFLGPSGSGKTTLLRMIAGLETPTSGEILIGGRVVNDLSPRARRIAVWVPRPSTSRTIKWKPWPWATASWCSTKVSFASSALPPMSMTILLTLSSPLFSARRQ